MGTVPSAGTIFRSSHVRRRRTLSTRSVFIFTMLEIGCFVPVRCVLGTFLSSWIERTLPSTGTTTIFRSSRL
uniref:Uncharacterized protein n=1 Tax=Arundo donax TaxID=35708 RepID=A0A0A9DAX3_ARUDO